MCFEVAKSQSGISSYGRNILLELLQDVGLLGCKPSPTHIVPKLKLSKYSGNPISDSSSYRRLIGKLLYLAHIRPDIHYAVSKLSQYLDASTNVHYQVAARVLRYIKNSIGAGIFVLRKSDLCLKGFTNSDWGACPDTCQSVTSFYFFLGNAPISWKSKNNQLYLLLFFLRLSTVL